MFANVIFPALSTPYIAFLFVPLTLVTTLCIETVAVWRMNERATLALSAGVTFLANFLSWLVGIVITSHLPLLTGLVTAATEDGDTMIVRGPRFGLYAVIGYILAAALSMLIEGAFLTLARPNGVERPWRTAVVANVASYALILAALFASS